jgi:hypothetical protein
VDCSALVFVERDVEHPMQGMFDPPMSLDELSRPLSTERSADDEVTHVKTLDAIAVGCHFPFYDRMRIPRAELAHRVIDVFQA